MTTQLQGLLHQDRTIAVPGVFDGVSAKIAQAMGFSVLYLSGASVSASRMGTSSATPLTLSDMVEAVSRIAGIVQIPLIADAGTGYGTITNVSRTMRELERSGAAAVILEDHEYPRTYTSQRRVISENDMIRRLESALSGRSNPDLLLIARTGALPVHGFQVLVDRIQAYERAGAEAILVDSIVNTAQMARIREEATVPLVYDLSVGSKAPLSALDEVGKLGFLMVLLESHALLTSAHAISRQWAGLIETGSIEGFSDQQMSLDELENLFRPPNLE